MVVFIFKDKAIKKYMFDQYICGQTVKYFVRILVDINYLLKNM